MRVMILISSIVAFFACNSSSGDVYVDESLMSYRPYAALTDSLQKKPTAEIFFRRGLLSYKLKGFRSAFNDYSTAFKLKPVPEFAEAVAGSLYSLKKYDSVISFINQQKKYFPANRYHEVLSLAYEKLGDYKTSLEHVTELIKLDSTNYFLIFQKATLLEDLGDTANAIIFYEQAAQKLPDFPDVKFALGNLYAETGNSKLLDIADKMIKDTVNFHAEPYYLEGVYYTKILDIPKAYAAFDKSIGKDWKYTDAYIDKGTLQYNNKNYVAALKVFETALAVDNTNPDVYYWIGRCKEALGEKEEAIDYYKRTLGLDENYEDAEDALKRLKAN